jgi:hypothetical protein
MTSAGLAGVDGRDAGAASGLVNTFHQLGSALGLGILVAVGVAATPGDASATAALVGQVTTALTGAAVMLAAALVLVVALIGERGLPYAPGAPLHGTTSNLPPRSATPAPDPGVRRDDGARPGRNRLRRPRRMRLSTRCVMLLPIGRPGGRRHLLTWAFTTPWAVPRAPDVKSCDVRGPRV